MVARTKKRHKAGRMRGKNSHGHGARKKWKGKGHHGGIGMSGSGKRADQKKTLVQKLYGGNYFGKQGITSKGTAKNRDKAMNLREIEKMDKKDVELKGYKILGDGELTKAVTIKAMAFSESAKTKIEKAGGKAIIVKVEKTENKEEK